MPLRLLMLVAVLALILTACGGDDDDNGADAEPTSTTAGVTSSPTAEQEPEPTETVDPTLEVTAETEPTADTEPAAGMDGDIPDTPVGAHLEWMIEVLNSNEPPTEAEFEERFTEEFSAQVSLVQLVAGIAQVSTEYGPFTFNGFAEPPTETQAVAELMGANDEIMLLAILTEEAQPYRIEIMQVVPADALDTSPADPASWDDFDDLLTEIAPQVSFQVSEIGDDSALQTIHGLEPDQQLAVGSAFKLYVLGELARQVEAGLVSWDDELEIHDEWKNLPHGTMQDETAGTSFTLREYAEQMISISDNTATDHLLLHLGRENVEAFQSEMGHGDPSVNMPMLTTREMFVLKLKFDEQQRADFIAASPEERRQILENEVAPQSVTIDDAVTWTGPIDIDTIEWFASAADLNRAMATLREMAMREGLEPLTEILSINTGAEFNPQVWTYAGFKGGSEPGVLNYTWLLERTDGRWFTLSVTVNNTEDLIDQSALLRAVGGAVLLLEQTR